MKAKIITVAILSIALLMLWFYNLSSFPLINKNQKIQSIQTSLVNASNSMKNMMLFIIPIIAMGFILYKTYLYKTTLFDVIPFDKLNRHLVILGATGSGKTTLAKKIIKKVMKKSKKPIYILDMHGEYSDLQIEKITFDEKTSFNIFDPWTLQPKKYLVFLINALKDILELSEPQAYILLKSLEEEYQERGYFEKRTELPIPPDINDIIQRIQKLQPKSRFDYEVKVALE